MGFKIGVAIPIGYYHGASGQTIRARIVDESGGVFGAELTLVENAAVLAAGRPGFYESSFTPDAAGTWSVIIYYSSVKYGQMFYDVGGGLTTQEKTDVEAEAVDALESFDLDHLLKVAHPTGDPVADSILDLLLNKDAGQTFDRTTDSLEFLGEINAAILADVTGIAGAVMRGTDNAATVADGWDAGLATILDNFTALRIGYLDELDFGLQEAIAAVAAQIVVVDEFHDVPGADVVTNALMRDVIGNKTDAPIQDADATQKSIIALVKGIHDVLWDDAGIAAWAAALAPANGVSFAEALRYVVENQFGSEYDGSPTLYETNITGWTGAAVATAVGSQIERLQLLQMTLVGNNTIFTTSAATVNTVTCAALVDRAGLYEKMMLIPTSGNQVGQGRYITEYDGTDVLTVVPDWSTDPDAAGNFTFVIKPVPEGFLYEAGKGLSASYDLINGIAQFTRVYNDYDILVLTVEETVYEYDNSPYTWKPDTLEVHLDEMVDGEHIEVKVYVKDNDTEDNWRLAIHKNYFDAQAVPVRAIKLSPTDLAIKVTVEQTGGTLRDVLFKLYKES